jgi:hypothetical protein
MIPTEETFKTLNEIRDTPVSEENSAKEIIDTEYQETINNYIKEYGTFFEIHKDGFLSGKNTKKKFNEVMKTIEAIFTGNYNSSKVSINAISFDYKELDKLFAEAGIKNKDQSKMKDKFIPKTPLNLYSSSNKLLRDYLNNYFTNDKDIYDELLLDILSLLYYFKIPVIGGKWIEHYKPEEEKNMRGSVVKSPRKEKNPKKRELSKAEIEASDIDELNDIIKEIIAILIDLFKSIKNNWKKIY